MGHLDFEFVATVVCVSRDDHHVTCSDAPTRPVTDSETPETGDVGR